jgi:hypothetical protein
VIFKTVSRSRVIKTREVLSSCEKKTRANHETNYLPIGTAVLITIGVRLRVGSAPMGEAAAVGETSGVALTTGVELTPGVLAAEAF